MRTKRGNTIGICGQSSCWAMLRISKIRLIGRRKRNKATITAYVKKLQSGKTLMSTRTINEANAVGVKQKTVACEDWVVASVSGKQWPWERVAKQIVINPMQNSTQLLSSQSSLQTTNRKYVCKGHKFLRTKRWGGKKIAALVSKVIIDFPNLRNLAWRKLRSYLMHYYSMEMSKSWS